MPVRHNHRKTPVTILAVSIGLALQMGAAVHAQEAAQTTESGQTTPAEGTVDTLDTVSVFVAPITWKMESAAAEVKTPPLIVALSVASTPPLVSVNVVSGLIVIPPPVLIVNELTAVFTAIAAGVLVNNTLVPVVKALVTISVPVLRERKMFEALPSVVPKLAPKPPTVLATTMYCRMPLFVVPAAPAPRITISVQLR